MERFVMVRLICDVGDGCDLLSTPFVGATEGDAIAAAKVEGWRIGVASHTCPKCTQEAAMEIEGPKWGAA